MGGYWHSHKLQTHTFYYKETVLIKTALILITDLKKQSQSHCAIILNTIVKQHILQTLTHYLHTWSQNNTHFKVTLPYFNTESSNPLTLQQSATIFLKLVKMSVPGFSLPSLHEAPFFITVVRN